MEQQNNQRMEEEILGGGQFDNNEQQFEILAENSSSPEDIFFDQVVAALQQIIVDQKFQNLQTNFMKSHCEVFQHTEENKIQYMTIFQKYQTEIQKHLEKSLHQMVPGFDMNKFSQLLQGRTEQIDEQILQILQSFTDFQTFKGLILDYKSYYEQEDRLRTLTIKSNKIPQNKNVKGSNNIFSNNNTFQIGGKSLAPLKKSEKNQKKQKKQQELLLPDFVITVRPLRKS